jgi:hypothetical protein
MNAYHGKPKYSEETCPSAALCTTNPTLIDRGSNWGSRDGKPKTNRQSYATAKTACTFMAGKHQISRQNVTFHSQNIDIYGD